jgi:hypothetical protein
MGREQTHRTVQYYALDLSTFIGSGWNGRISQQRKLSKFGCRWQYEH